MHEALRPCLHEDIAETRGLNGSGEHDEPRAIGRALAQQIIQRTAAHHMNRSDVNPPERRRLTRTNIARPVARRFLTGTAIATTEDPFSPRQRRDSHASPFRQ